MCNASQPPSDLPSIPAPVRTTETCPRLCSQGPGIPVGEAATGGATGPPPAPRNSGADPGVGSGVPPRAVVPVRGVVHGSGLLSRHGEGLEWVDDARAAAQAQVEAPIVCVGFLQPGGSWGAFGVSKFNPVAGSVQQGEANRRAGGIAKAGGFTPKVAMLAVTAETVEVFLRGTGAEAVGQGRRAPGDLGA